VPGKKRKSRKGCKSLVGEVPSAVRVAVCAADAAAAEKSAAAASSPSSSSTVSLVVGACGPSMTSSLVDSSACWNSPPVDVTVTLPLSGRASGHADSPGLVDDEFSVSIDPSDQTKLETIFVEIDKNNNACAGKTSFKV